MHGENLAGVVLELHEFGDGGIERGRFCDEVDGHAWPFNIEPMQHVVCGVVELQDLSFFKGFIAIEEDLWLLGLGWLIPSLWFGLRFHCL